jgi:hypothetical protein
LRAKGGGLSLDDDRPVGETWRHDRFLRCCRFSPGPDWARGA